MLKREEISTKLMEDYKWKKPKDLKDLFEKSQVFSLKKM